MQRGSARSPARVVNASCGVNPDSLVVGMMHIDCTFLVRALYTLWIEPRGEEGKRWLMRECNFLRNGTIDEAMHPVGLMRPLVMKCFFNPRCDALRGESTLAITSCVTDGVSFNFLFKELRPLATSHEYQKGLPYVTQEMLAYYWRDVVVLDPG